MDGDDTNLGRVGCIRVVLGCERFRSHTSVLGAAAGANCCVRLRAPGVCAGSSLSQRSPKPRRTGLSVS